MVWNIAGKGFTRFRAQAAIDERSRQSDIGPAVRFFVFTEKPEPRSSDPSCRVMPRYQPPRKQWTSQRIAGQTLSHLLARKPTDEEKAESCSEVRSALGIRS